jgi:hypothetical protein
MCVAIYTLGHVSPQAGVVTQCMPVNTILQRRTPSINEEFPREEKK